MFVETHDLSRNILSSWQRFSRFFSFFLKRITFLDKYKDKTTENWLKYTNKYPKPQYNFTLQYVVRPKNHIFSPSPPFVPSCATSIPRSLLI